MTEQIKVLVTGAGGFIGHHLTKYLVDRGYWVRGVDIKEPEYEATAAQEFKLLDLRFRENCLEATEGMDQVYGLAANMGGIGFIESHKGEIVRDSSFINLHTIDAAQENGVKRYFYTSSACIYPGYKQNEATLLREDAYRPTPKTAMAGRSLWNASAATGRFGPAARGSLP
jgi:nucleoside-diphosphate-sugar epimerase